jgi:hypothetical protein
MGKQNLGKVPAHMRTQLIAATCLITILTGVADAEKQRDWQTGKVLDTDRNRYFAGTYDSGSGFGVPVYRTYALYAIEAEKYVYLTEERLPWRWSKPARLIVNTPVKFAAEKRKLFIVDDDGKEHETKIVKQVLKQ